MNVNRWKQPNDLITFKSDVPNELYNENVTLKSSV